MEGMVVPFTEDRGHGTRDNFGRFGWIGDMMSLALESFS